MKITREGSRRTTDPKVLLEREGKPEIGASGVVFRFRRVMDPYDIYGTTQHDYTVELSRKDLRQVIGALFDAATEKQPRL